MPFRPWDSCGDQAPCRGVVGFLWARRGLWLGSGDRRGVPRYRGFRTPMTTFLVTQRHRCHLPACDNSAPNAEYLRRTWRWVGLVMAPRWSSSGRSGVACVACLVDLAKRRRPPDGGALPCRLRPGTCRWCGGRRPARYWACWQRACRLAGGLVARAGNLAAPGEGCGPGLVRGGEARGGAGCARVWGAAAAVAGRCRADAAGAGAGGGPEPAVGQGPGAGRYTHCARGYRRVAPCSSTWRSIPSTLRAA